MDKIDYYPLYKIYYNTDYEKEVNGKTIIEGSLPHPLCPELTIRGKFFQILPYVWAHLDNPDLRSYNGERAKYLGETYCNDNDEKTAYLTQLITLFKRLVHNSPTACKLFKFLNNGVLIAPYKSNPCDLMNPLGFIKTPTSVEIINTLIMPPRCLGSYVEMVPFSKKYTSPILSAEPALLNIVPDAVMVYKNKNGDIVYQDPALTLAHELIHCMHNALGLYDYLEDELELVIEQFTFGGNGVNLLPKGIVEKYLDAIMNKYEKTCAAINESQWKDLKGIFGNRYGLVKTSKINRLCGGPTYTFKKDNYFKFIKEVLYEINETNIANELKVTNRDNYDTHLLDVVKIYHKDSYNPSNGLNEKKLNRRTGKYPVYDHQYIMPPTPLKYLTSLSIRTYENTPKEEKTNFVDLMESILGEERTFDETHSEEVANWIENRNLNDFNLEDYLKNLPDISQKKFQPKDNKNK